jgi:hypothetical protein
MDLVKQRNLIHTSKISLQKLPIDVTIFGIEMDDYKHPLKQKLPIDDDYSILLQFLRIYEWN